MRIPDPRRAFFDQLAPVWEESAQRTSSLQAVLEAVSPQPGQRILDLGAGTGWFSHLLFERTGGRCRVVAADFSPAMLEVAQRKGLPVFLCQADAHWLPFRPSSFDTAVLLAAFPHFRNQAKVLWEIRRILRRGGKLVIAHLIGKEEIAAVHSRAGDPIAHDCLPEDRLLRGWLAMSGFQVAEWVDQPDLFLVVARRQR
jgi:demethylmenaquinone methyltransferase/2-methoxy-6-polyprenyl-1,4-benzoquinol methylase